MPTKSSNNIFDGVTSRKNLCDLLKYPLPEFSFLVEADEDSLYRVFTIRKRKGGRRVICAPKSPLIHFQRQFNVFLVEAIRERNAFRRTVHGFIPGRSIITNASIHTGKRFVFNLDLLDFFPSISQARIYGLFKADPFGASKGIAEQLAKVCCFCECLPQGAPTSPTLSNFICYKMDRQLQAVAKKHGCIYTRYADDITFSRRSGEIPTEISKQDSSGVYGAGDVIRNIIESNKFSINRNKVRLYKNTTRQTVTGLVVNEGINVHREFIKNLRAMIHDCKINGIEKATEKHVKHYRRKDKSSGMPDILKIIEGKLAFLKMTRGINDPVRKHLQGKYALINDEYRAVIIRETKEAQMKDFFLCHASEDKDNFVRPLALSLQNLGARVWYDEFEMTLGDDLVEKINNGLANTTYGVVVFSEMFFQKKKFWTPKEVSGLFALEEAYKRKCILPIWYCISKERVAEHSPLLANRIACVVSPKTTIDQVASQFKSFIPKGKP